MKMVRVTAYRIPNIYKLKIKPIEEEYNFLCHGCEIKLMLRLKMKIVIIAQIDSMTFFFSPVAFINIYIRIF